MQKDPQRVIPRPPNAVAHKICSCWYAVFLDLQTAINWIQQKRLSSNQCALCHYLIFHSIWSRNHWILVVLWPIVSSGRFIGALARNIALLRRLLTVRLLIHPQRVCSTEKMLSDEPFKKYIFSWGRFQISTCPLAFFYTPGLVDAVKWQSTLHWIIQQFVFRTYLPLPFQPLIISLHLIVVDVPYRDKI